VTIEGNKIAEIPLLDITTIVVVGNVQISTQSLVLFLERGIDICYLSNSYKFRGNLLAQTSGNVFLKLTQFERFQDEVFKVDPAKTFVRG